MAEKKSFLLRISPELWDEIQRMAAEDLRSVNGEIEFLLREAMQRRGRLRSRRRSGSDASNNQ